MGLCSINTYFENHLMDCFSLLFPSSIQSCYWNNLHKLIVYPSQNLPTLLIPYFSSSISSFASLSDPPQFHLTHPILYIQSILKIVQCTCILVPLFLPPKNLFPPSSPNKEVEPIPYIMAWLAFFFSMKRSLTTPLRNNLSLGLKR